MRYSWLLVFALAGLGSTPALSQNLASSPLSNVPITESADVPSGRFRCQLNRGPRYTACTTSFDGADAALIKAWLEATPPCLIPKGQLGSIVTGQLIYKSGEPESTSHFGSPDFDREDAGNAMAFVRPPASGRVVLACVVSAAGRAENCTAESEVPAGVGLADVAKQVGAKIKFKPASRDCQPMDGAKIRIPLSFELR